MSADQIDAANIEFKFSELVQAYHDCRKTKRNTPNALAFEQNLERNLISLYEELNNSTYTPGKSIRFVVTRPKPRDVWAADFRDRVVHHLVYNFVSPRFHARFIADSCACIPGRGTLYGAKRLESKVRSVTRNWSRPAFYLKCDLANFFVSIDKFVLQKLLDRNIAEPFWHKLASIILWHDPRLNFEVRGSQELLDRVPAHKQLTNHPPNLGLPIGNLWSQFLANVLLNVFDQYAKHQLGARYYIRYVDDFIFLHESSSWLSDVLAKITDWLPATLGVRLNPAKTILQPVDRGIDFVGHVIRPWHVTPRKRTANEALSRMKNANADDFFTMANSYFGLIGQSDSSLRRRAAMAKICMARGHAVHSNLTKIYKKKGVKK